MGELLREAEHSWRLPEPSSMENGELWAAIDHAERYPDLKTNSPSIAGRSLALHKVSKPEHLMDVFDLRCLVSAMHEEAVEATTSILSALSSEAQNEVYRLFTQESRSSSEKNAREELLPMVDAAGMVLLQALNEMGRSSSIFDNLVSIFGCVDNVPYTLVLIGTCLQLAGGFHPSLQLTLEEYLSGWTIGSNADGFMVKNVQLPLNNENVERTGLPASTASASSLHFLPKKDYLQLTEIYTMEILAKVCKNAGAAYLWIQNSSVTEEEKQVIVERLDLWSELQRPRIDHRADQSATQRLDTCYETSSSTDNKSMHNWEDRATVQTFENETVAAGTGSLVSDEADPAPSEEAQSMRIVRGSGTWRLPLVNTIERLMKLLVIRATDSANSKWAFSKYMKVMQPNVLATGAVMYVMFHALLLKRQQLKRWLLQIVNLASLCFGDLWQLAFTVHLNPLAAVP